MMMSLPARRRGLGLGLVLAAAALLVSLGAVAAFTSVAAPHRQLVAPTKIGSSSLFHAPASAAVRRQCNHRHSVLVGGGGNRRSGAKLAPLSATGPAAGRVAVKHGARPVLATAVAAVNTALFATVGGGILAGGLHAVSGPDHLAALLPRIMGKTWANAMR